MVVFPRSSSLRIVFKISGCFGRSDAFRPGDFITDATDRRSPLATEELSGNAKEPASLTDVPAHALRMLPDWRWAGRITHLSGMSIIALPTIDTASLDSR